MVNIQESAQVISSKSETRLKQQYSWLATEYSQGGEGRINGEMERLLAQTIQNLVKKTKQAVEDRPFLSHTHT